jgi:hypothetical protein
MSIGTVALSALVLGFGLNVPDDVEEFDAAAGAWCIRENPESLNGWFHY